MNIGSTPLCCLDFTQREVFRDALQQKTVTTDFLTKKRVENREAGTAVLCGEQPRGDHPEGPFHDGAGGDGPQGQPGDRDREEEGLQREVGPFEHRVLWPLR